MRNQVGPAGDAQLGVDPLEVVVDRPGGHEQAVGDLRTGQPLDGQQRRNVETLSRAADGLIKLVNGILGKIQREEAVANER